MRQGRGDRVHVGVEAVGAADIRGVAVVAGHVVFQQRAADPVGALGHRLAHVRHAPAAQVGIAQVPFRPRADAAPVVEGDAQAVVGHVVAVGNLSVLHHQVQPQRLVVGKDAVGVELQPGQAAGGHAALGLVELLKPRALAFLVDEAAQAAHAEAFAGRALDDLHRLGVEGVAGIGAEVAQPVRINVALRGQAADAELVARGAPPALAGGQRDAGDVAQRLFQRGGLLLLDDLGGDHVHDLRRVAHACRKAGDTGRGVVGVARLLVRRGQDHGVQLHRVRLQGSGNGCILRQRRLVQAGRGKGAKRGPRTTQDRSKGGLGTQSHKQSLSGRWGMLACTIRAGTRTG